jgi:hypothetical protein
MIKLLSVRQIHLQRKVYWIKSYKCLLLYFSKTHPHILKPIVMGKKSGKRYFVSEENLERFVRMFEENKLH